MGLIVEKGAEHVILTQTLSKENKNIARDPFV
jgi:hypothetical protein